jgi:hypothetical protein
MNNQPNPVFQKYDQLFGKSAPTVVGTSKVPSWGDKIDALAKSTSVPDSSKNPTPMSEAVSKTGQDYSNAVSSFGAEAGRNDKSTSANPIVRTGENALGATASGIGTVFAPITNAIKSASDSFAQGAKDPLNKNQSLYDNPVVSKILDLFGKGSDKLDSWATTHPEAARNLSNLLTVGTAALGGEAGADKPVGSIEGIKSGATDLGQGIKETAQSVSSKVADTTGNIAGKIKEGVSPSYSPSETTGKIIQGATEDIPSAQRALSSLDTRGVKTYSDLQKRIDAEIKTLAPQVDKELLRNPLNGKSVKSFEQTIGEGKSGVKVNYVDQGIKDLRDFFEKTNDAKGLAKINQIENNSKIKGLNYKDINDLAKLHGQTIKAFNANGEAASGLSKQAAENTRKGLKSLARSGLGGEESKALDAKLTDLYDTKSLIDNMVEKVNSASQKTPKQGVIPKTVGKAVKGIDTLSGGSIRAVGKAMGNAGASGALSPVEIEAELVKNLKLLRNK